jgi:hypothetical protein
LEGFVKKGFVKVKSDLHRIAVGKLALEKCALEPVYLSG